MNFSRELTLRGHRVYLAVNFDPKYQEESRRWFSSLREQGVISDFFELSYSPLRWRTWCAARVMYPQLRNWILRQFQAVPKRTVDELIAKLGIDTVIVANRRLLFLASTLSPSTPCIVDFCDCGSLYLAREIRHFVHTRQYRRLLLTFLSFLNIYSEERYYARRATASLAVSPVDALALARVAGNPPNIYTLLNGVTLPPWRTDVEKIRTRLIFSGNMDFPPNYVAALWLLDHVFPRVVEQVPEAQLVLAGANPPDPLKARARHNVVVTGYVQDLNHEIACSALYVAPLMTGSGFKNKIVEAIANRTYVVATPFAVEFLDSFTRGFIAVADSEQGMADLIVSLLRDPAVCASRLAALYDRIGSTFTWARRTDELLEIIGACLSREERQHAT